MPIFLSCFSAGSAGSSPTSSQNATLPSSSAWPLSASGYSSSFSSIASAPSIAGTAFLLPQLLHSQEKALGVFSQCSQECCPRQKWVWSPVLGGSSPGSSAVGNGGWWAWDCAEEKMDLFHLVSLSVGIEIFVGGALSRASAGTDPSRKSWCEICVKSTHC